MEIRPPPWTRGSSYISTTRGPQSPDLNKTGRNSWEWGPPQPGWNRYSVRRISGGRRRTSSGKIERLTKVNSAGLTTPQRRVSVLDVELAGAHPAAVQPRGCARRVAAVRDVGEDGDGKPGRGLRDETLLGPYRALGLAAVAVVDRQGDHALLVEDPGGMAAHQLGGFGPVLGDELGLLGAGVTDLDGADDLGRDRARQRDAGKARARRREHGEQQQRDDRDEPDPLGRRLALLATPARGSFSGTRIDAERRPRARGRRMSRVSRGSGTALDRC
jgi:hypothetical protein